MGGSSADRPSAADDSPGAPGATPEGAAPTTDEVPATAAALARARAAAAAKGFRPGMRPMRRRRPPGVTPTAQRDRRDPTLIGDTVDRLLAERGWGTDVAAGSVIGRWNEIVGPEVAAHAQPTAFDDGVLTVRGDSTAWATQLRLMSNMLLGRIETEVGPGVVTELRIVGPSAPSWVRGSRRVSDGRGPRDTYG